MITDVLEYKLSKIRVDDKKLLSDNVAEYKKKLRKDIGEEVDAHLGHDKYNYKNA